jgi:nitrogen fixation/metabolism regulation signal transduction histidine kinase
MDTKPLKRRATALAAVSLLSVSLLASLILMSAAIQNSGKFGATYSVLLILNSIGLLTFVALIAINIRRLIKQLRQREAGARLTLRMLVIFVTLAIIPVLIVYGFSLDFLRRGIDSWFDVEIDSALTDSLELSRAALDLKMRDLLNQTEQMAYEVGQGSRAPTPLNLDILRNPDSTIVANSTTTPATDLDLLRERSGAEELSLLTREGRVLGSSTGATAIVPNLPPNAILLQLQQGRSYIGLDPIRDAGLYIRVAVNVPEVSLGSGRKILHVLYPVATRLNRLADSVESAYVEYTELAYLRDKLKLSFAMTLTLVLLFSIVTAVWAAFYSARRLAKPIRDLAAGTAAVAQGNYETSLPVQSNDDIGFLVRSFNDMTKRVALARAEVQAQHQYLDTVLGQLSSGVIALNEDSLVTTINDSAQDILGLGDSHVAGLPLSAMADEKQHLRPFVDGIIPLLDTGDGRWQQQIVIFRPSGRRVLMCRGTRMATNAPNSAGNVIVFDNITALIEGQRDAAWSEVARRLAHEIKNPLTPIQLSADRLRQKYLKKMSPEDSKTLERLTSTIIQQVDTMKSMVNTFSDYARPPKINPEATDLNELVRGVVELFKSAHREVKFDLELDDQLLPMPADASRLRQVINNLVKNAIEASAQVAQATISVRTHRFLTDSETYVEIEVSDQGEGINSSLAENIFEPYVTNKTKGTGLGLAIVKKIIEEHGGVVTLENNIGPGAAAIIRLPITGVGDTLTLQVEKSDGKIG